MDGMEDYKRLEILELFLLPYFVEYEHFEIGNELSKQIKLIKNFITFAR
jgi:hypothetical protein